MSKESMKMYTVTVSFSHSDGAVIVSDNYLSVGYDEDAAIKSISDEIEAKLDYFGHVGVSFKYSAKRIMKFPVFVSDVTGEEIGKRILRSTIPG